MKTIKEQIEILKAFDDGEKIAEYYLAHPAVPSKPVLRKMIDKEQQPDYQFNFLDYHYEIHKEVKPLFPTKEQGAKYVVEANGLILNVHEHKIRTEAVEDCAKQGRTFYTREDAEAFARRKQAKRYCLETINRVNKGDNGFMDGHFERFHVFYDNEQCVVDYRSSIYAQSLEPNEYIRTEEAARELLNDAEFVENWKCFKGIGE